MWASHYGTVFLLLMPNASFVSGKRLKKTPEKKTGNKGEFIWENNIPSTSLSPLETANGETCLGIHRL